MFFLPFHYISLILNICSGSLMAERFWRRIVSCFSSVGHRIVVVLFPSWCRSGILRQLIDLCFVAREVFPLELSFSIQCFIQGQYSFGNSYVLIRNHSVARRIDRGVKWILFCCRKYLDPDQAGNFYWLGVSVWLSFRRPELKKQFHSM